jgi:hypothetical protein
MEKAALWLRRSELSVSVEGDFLDSQASSTIKNNASRIPEDDLIGDIK